MIGKPYIIQHFLNEVRKDSRERLYKTYVTDMLRNILTNTAGGEERYRAEKRWIEIAERQPTKKEEEKPEETEEEVIARIRNKLSKIGG